MAVNFLHGSWWFPFLHKHDFYDFWKGWNFGNGRSDDCRPKDPAPTIRTVTVESALAVSVVGGADAFGQDTTALADVSLHVVDRGLATFAFGDADFLAAAQAGTDESAFAATYADLAITGADLSIVKSSTGMSGDEAETAAATAINFVALDLKFDLCAGNGEPHLSSDYDSEAGIGILEGNSAVFAVDVSASGENSFVDVQADALALEDAFSTVAVSTTAAVDVVTTYTEIIGTRRADRIVHTDAGDTLVRAGKGDDEVHTSSGNDWIFGERGKDALSSGAGHDTVFGGDGRDCIDAGDGDDWVFGGDDDDWISAGAGADLLLGGDDDDFLLGGAGDDILCGGDGRDKLYGGDGDDIFRLGSRRGDDDDAYWGGSGADLYLLQGEFERDVISDFSLAQGDRLVLADRAETVLCGRRAFTMERSHRDADDLVVSFRMFDGRAELTLDEFFSVNAGFSGMPRRGDLSQAQAAAVLSSVTVDMAHVDGPRDAELLFQLGDMLSLLG